MRWLNWLLSQRRGLEDPGTPPEWAELARAVLEGWEPGEGAEWLLIGGATLLGWTIIMWVDRWLHRTK